jgi:hypothetical protein
VRRTFGNGSTRAATGSRLLAQARSSSPFADRSSVGHRIGLDGILAGGPPHRCLAGAVCPDHGAALTGAGMLFGISLESCSASPRNTQ